MGTGALVETEKDLLAALQRGDEAAFLSLVNQHHSAMLRVCRLFVSDLAAAEEVVQDTWLAALESLHRFEGRSSLKTWLYAILTNKAKTRGVRESRSLPFSALEAEPAVDPERFHPKGQEWAGHWAEKPRPWERVLESQALSNELLATVQAAIENLPESQRMVISLRDIEGWTSAEVCNILDLSETNQRVLLHRARSKVRRALEVYFDAKAGST
jgi:RNA polymerase sigma-70 factor (ECF subfamily)